jgi:hypothetical protein
MSTDVAITRNNRAAVKFMGYLQKVPLVITFKSRSHFLPTHHRLRASVWGRSRRHDLVSANNMADLKDRIADTARRKASAIALDCSRSEDPAPDVDSRGRIEVI